MSYFHNPLRGFGDPITSPEQVDPEEIEMEPMDVGRPEVNVVDVNVTPKAAAAAPTASKSSMGLLPLLVIGGVIYYLTRKGWSR